MLPQWTGQQDSCESSFMDLSVTAAMFGAYQKKKSTSRKLLLVVSNPQMMHLHQTQTQQRAQSEVSSWTGSMFIDHQAGGDKLFIIHKEIWTLTFSFKLLTTFTAQQICFVQVCIFSAS